MRYLLLFALVISNPVSAQLPKVAVLDLASKSLGVEQVTSLTNKLTQELFKSGYYDIMERAHLDKVFGEQMLQQTDLVADADKAAQAGKLIGVRKVFIGSVELADKTYSVNIKLVDVETGRIEHMVTKEFDGPYKKLLQDGIRAVVEKLTKEAPSLQPIDLEFSFIVLRDAKTFSVQSGDTLMSGDKVHLLVKPNQRCFIYMVNQDAKGNVYSIFPNPTQRYKALEAGKEYHIPAEESSFELDEVTGTETIYVTASLQPVQEIEQLIFQDKVEAVQKEKLLNHIATRGFAKIVKGNDVKVKLEKGISFEGNTSILSGTETFQHKVVFEHVAK